MGGALVLCGIGGGTLLSVTTDYEADTGCPAVHLERIAAAGFTHVHWCHHWNTDFLYSSAEIGAIAGWLSDLGLSVTDMHGSAGREKEWCSTVDYCRLSGVELVANRLAMAEALGTDVVVMHLPDLHASPDASAWAAVWRTLDALHPAAEAHGVRIAIENGSTVESFEAIGAVLDRCPPDYVGLCYDSGHGNMLGTGLEWLERFADRLIAVHLHDNDGSGDQHRIPFDGSVDWPRLAGIVAHSSYEKWASLEVSMRTYGAEEPAVFLTKAKDTGARIGRMMDAHRG